MARNPQLSGITDATMGMAMAGGCWRGSIQPVHSDYFQVSHYIYSDSTGAEYRLDINTSNVWSGKEGAYVRYDATANRVYFPDGTFWVMGAESDGVEFDAGTRYPTLMQDTNGNQILITYRQGVGAPTGNSSSRINTVTDVKTTYTFNYNGESIANFTSADGFTTRWTFTFVPITANSPWTPSQNPPNNVSALSTAMHTTGGIQTFHYYASGELAEVFFPYGGKLRWTYSDWTSSTQRVVREVNQRFQKKDSQAATPETAHNFLTNPTDNTREYHSYRVVRDQSNAYDKAWWFYADRTLQTLDERKLPSQATTRRTQYFWTTQPTSQQRYISQVDTTLEPGTANAKTKRSTQTLDQFGNVTMLPSQTMA